MGTGFAAHCPEPAERHAPLHVAVAEATDDDVPLLAALQARVRGGTADAWARRIERARSAPRSVVVTAKAASVPVGYANAAWLPEHPDDHAPAGCYLTGVTVDPARRRRGVARLLTRWRMEWAWAREPAVWCFVSARNPASLDLHGGLGFVPVAAGASFQGVAFTGGAGWLLRAVPDGAAEVAPGRKGKGSQGAFPRRKDPR